MAYKKVYLKPGKEESLKRFHPWVFSGAIQRIEGEPEEVFRLSDFSRDDFLGMMTKGVKGYSHAELLTKL